MSDSVHEAMFTWAEGHLGFSLTELGPEPLPLFEIDGEDVLGPLVMAKRGGNGALGARAPWLAQLRPLTQALSMDLLFSPFGCSELARVTLPDGYGIWGPTWYLFGDRSTLASASDTRPALWTADRLGEVDFDVFWHCRREALAGFGIEEEERLVAMATVLDCGAVWEVGMDVQRDTRGRGLGRAVVAAAAQWILDHERLVLATVGPFNIPSTRTLRSVGLQHQFTVTAAFPGPFHIPPQPLGTPLPGAEVYDFYPRWAMNQAINPRPGSAT